MRGLFAAIQRSGALLCLGVVCSVGMAQAPEAANSSAPTTPDTSHPATPATPAHHPSRKPSSDAAQLKEVLVRGQRAGDEELRRQSSAAKMVIGREEIDRQGDSSLGDVLKRLPGVTLQGAPGRGGAIRLRGLGSGYTQILLDGQRVPPGFSIESITPEMVERIEILRAPTAETGARAVAGTINIILREGQRLRNQDVRLGWSREGAHDGAGLQWTAPFQTEMGLQGSFSLSYLRGQRPDDTWVQTKSEWAGQYSEKWRHTERTGERSNLHLNARMQYKTEEGSTLVLMPFFVYSTYGNRGQVDLWQSSAGATSTDAAQLQSDNRFAMGRLNGQWNTSLTQADKLELKWGMGQSSYRAQFAQTPTGSTGLLPTLLETQEFTDRSGSFAAKHSRTLDADQLWSSGIEVETVRRVETGNGSAAEDGGDLRASTWRWAIYTQDEWTLTPQWSTSAGLRYETIATQGSIDADTVHNRSAVLSPLLHAVYKIEPNSRSQWRMSFSRSYKTPSMAQLVARPSLSRDYALTVENSPTQPDRIGNPSLKPELATGVDLGLEHYLSEGGVLSANVFYRRIHNLIRSVTSPRTDTAWSPGITRYVSSPQNVGQASTQGLELEAKFNMAQLSEVLPKVDVRANLSFYDSRVEQVPGPDNRLDQQPHMSANVGADYRFRSWPLTLGASLNHNPAYDTRLSENQYAYQGIKRVLDVYGLWRFSPNAALRLSVTHALAEDYITASSYIGSSDAETARTTDRSWRTVQLRLELKL